MERDGSGVDWRMVIGGLVAALCLMGGCGDSSGGGGGGETTPADTGTSEPEISISEGCKTACDNFMSKCGKMTPVTRTDCEIECEREWSDQLETCVRQASVCADIEVCASGSGSDAGGGDAGGVPETGTSADAVDAASDVGDDG